ncbi:MAG: 3-deoxy-manno-octulosonate cytidylyltransferase [Pseudomonadota bacterium]
MSRFKVVIPARYASTRLPGKPLLPIAGRPMIAHVCERAIEAEADEVVVATDDERICTAVSGLGVRAVMTSPLHTSGTERLAEVARTCAWSDDEIVVNLQGDEPLVPAPLIRDLAAVLTSGTEPCGVATLATPIRDHEEIFNPNIVKVVLDRRGRALYFSRAPIPWDRNGFGQGAGETGGKIDYLRHIGMYAYSAGFLQRYIGWTPSLLEKVESLEQLRILWHGESIAVRVIADAPEAGVDTNEDLMRVEKALARIN